MWRGFGDTQVLQYASKGALEPLDDYARQYGMTRDKYKRVYYDGCNYQGTLYAIPSTGVVCRDAVEQGDFRKKDPPRSAPRGLIRISRRKRSRSSINTATAIDTWDKKDGNKLTSAGLIPLEPGTCTNEMGYWFGATIADPTGTKMLINSPE